MDMPEFSNLQQVGEIPPETMIAMYTNNQLRLMVQESCGLTRELWDEFAEKNVDAVREMRAFWGLDVTDGWLDRSWDTEGTYEIVDTDQYNRAKESAGDAEKETESAVDSTAEC